MREMIDTQPVARLETKAKLFRSFGDPSRLSMLEVLREGGRNVSDLVELTGLTQPGVSNHLACLLDCGLVVREQRGRHAFYTLSSPGVESLLELADEVLGALTAEIEACQRYTRPTER